MKRVKKIDPSTNPLFTAWLQQFKVSAIDFLSYSLYFHASEKLSIVPIERSYLPTAMLVTTSLAPLKCDFSYKGFTVAYQLLRPI